jgi:hypothetical protein
LKLIIQSNSGPYGLNRRAVTAVCSVLPADIVAQIDRLVLVSERWGHEPFEYDPKRKVAYFAYPGDPNIESVRDGALRELLLGFARLEAGDKFKARLTAKQRDSFNAFIDHWHEACSKAIKDQANNKA